MQRIDSDGVSAVLPVAGSAGATIGYFTEGDPGVGILGTKVTADWLNGIQEELSKVIEEAGLTLDKAANDQLYQALLTHISENAITGTLGATANIVPVTDGTGGLALKASPVEINAGGEMGSVAALAVGAAISSLDDTAALQVESTTKGFLMPRMSSAEVATLGALNPPNGMLVYDETSQAIQLRQSGEWADVLTAGPGLYYVGSQVTLDAAIADCTALGGGQIIMTQAFSITAPKIIPSNTVFIGRKAATLLTFSGTGSLELQDESELRDLSIETALASGTLVTTTGDRCKINNCKVTVPASSSLTCVLLNGDFGTVSSCAFDGVIAGTATGIDFGSGFENVEERNIFA